MGQGRSREESGAGLGGTGVADDVLALDCVIAGTVAGLSSGTPGAGTLRQAGGELIVVDSAGNRLATLDAGDPTVACLSACMAQSFRYTGVVAVSPTGVTTIDVAPDP